MPQGVLPSMKAKAFLILLALAGCAPPRPAAPAASETAAVERPERAEAVYPPGAGSAETVVEREFRVARGPAALERVKAAPSSVVAVSYQGLPRPITGPDGRITYAGPAVNAVFRADGRWLGWKSGSAAPLPAAVAARLDSLLADPALWREPDGFPPGGCTDAGSLQLAVRHRGRLKLSRQDNCDSRGLAGELGRTVLNEAPVTR